MMKMYCPYCGKLLEEGCECERLAYEEHESMMEEVEERQLRDAWQQDLIDLYRFER